MIEASNNKIRGKGRAAVQRKIVLINYFHTYI
jgi:hypothetical protein